MLQATDLTELLWPPSVCAHAPDSQVPDLDSAVGQGKCFSAGISADAAWPRVCAARHAAREPFHQEQGIASLTFQTHPGRYRTTSAPWWLCPSGLSLIQHRYKLPRPHHHSFLGLGAFILEIPGKAVLNIAASTPRRP